MKCQNCQFDNPSQMKFCGECGTKLQLLCPGCGTEAVAGFKFCGECGTPLAGPAAAAPSPVAAPVPVAAPAPVAESVSAHPAPAAATPLPTAQPTEGRHEPLPAVLPGPQPTASESSSAHRRDGEIKQVTAMVCHLESASGNEFEAEMVHQLLNRLVDMASEEVGRYGGVIQRTLDRGVLALFGAPVAYEDHATRAALAALGLQERVTNQADELEQRGGARWQVSMGLDTGSVVVGGVGDMAVGDTISLAGRLQELAEPGDALVSGTTAGLIEQDVELKEVTLPLDWQGGPEVTAWRLRGPASVMAPEALSGAYRSLPFVGRKRELSILEELREQATEGRGQLAAVVGEAGAGKSRLLYEFRHSFRGQRMSYLRGRCLSYGSGIPYHPFVDMIRRGSRIAESDSASTVVAKMRASLEQVGIDSADSSLPFLLRLLGIRQGTESLEGMEPQAVQAGTFSAMRRMLLDAGRSSLVMVEIEDLHWIDDTSRDFLTSLVEVLAPARMLLILTYRSGYQLPWLEKSYATQITTRNLDVRDSQTLVEAILQQADIDQELAADVLAKAEGNPFFLEELARSLVDRSEDPSESIPNTIQGVLMARIDRLPDQHKRLLQMASVLGREMSVDLLAAIWQRPEPLEGLLEDLQRWEFLYKAPSEDRLTFYFRHALTQEVAYLSLLSDRRRILHGRAAHALERLFADRLEDVYDLLTYHFPRAGEPEKTVNYLSLFADRAARNYAHAEAAKALREALVHGEKLAPEEKEQRVMETLLKLAESLLPLARFPETLELFHQYRDRVEALDQDSLTAGYCFWLAHTQTYLGDQESASLEAARAIEAARQCGDEATEGKAHYVLGRVGFWSGKFADGIDHSLRAVVLLERSDEPWWQGQAYWVAGFNHYALGRFDEAIDALERAKAIGQALADDRLDTSWSLGYFFSSLGEWESGIEQCRQGMEISKDPLNTAVASGFLGYALLQKPDLPAAISTLRDSIDRLRATGMQQILGWVLGFLGEAYLQEGRLEEAEEAASEGFATTQEAAFAYGSGLAQRTLGRIAFESGNLDASRQHLEGTLATFNELAVPFELARTHLEIARLEHAASDSALAKKQLDEATRLFTELNVPKFLEQAKQIGTTLGVSVS